MRNIKVIVEYDGTGYLGFQRMPKGKTIQGELEAKISKVMKEPIKVIGAGRTDAGVHALGQVINFKTASKIPINKVCIALNSLLPKDIVARKAAEVSERFHARYDAKSKIYRYMILNRETPSALFARFVCYVPQPLDLAAMRCACPYFIGTHDFYSFSLSGGQTRDAIRTIYFIKCAQRGKLICITSEANGFLRGMARKIVGALIKVGQGKIEVSEIEKILEVRDRRITPPAAPAQGLCLMKVRY